jgi:hypothetical protein
MNQVNTEGLPKTGGASNGVLFAAALLAIAGLAACSSSDDRSPFEPGVIVPPPGQVAMVYAIRGGNELVRFDGAAPSNVTSIGMVTGLSSGEVIVGLDFRPTGPTAGDLHAVTSEGGMLIIDPETAMGTAIQDIVGDGTALVAGRFGVDFNPAANALRVIGSDGLNLRVPTAALVAPAPATPVNTLVDGRMGYRQGVTAAGYTNRNPGATGTMLYVIDTENDRLFQQDANNGPLTEIGTNGLGVDATAANGYDVVQVGEANEHYTVLTVGSTSALYTLDVGTGAATMVAALPSADYVGMIAAAENDEEPNERLIAPMRENSDGSYTVEVYALDISTDTLVPDGAELAVTGLPDGESLVGFDVRTTSMEEGLDVGYAVGASGSIYTLTDVEAAGEVTALMATEVAELSVALSGESFGVDFNPRADLLRIVSDAGQNLRVNLQDQRPVACRDGVAAPRDPGFACVDGATRLVSPAPQIVATAYRAAPTDGTFQFAIDARDSQLYRVAVPNDGALVPVGPLGVTLPVNGDGAAAQSFEIVGTDQGEVGLLALRTAGQSVSTLYGLNLATGATQSAGAIGNDGAVSALTVRFEVVTP